MMENFIRTTFVTIMLLGIIACDPSVSPSQGDSKGSPSQAVDPIIGLDVSSHQGNINFYHVKKAGYDFVFIRATDGVDYQDPNYDSNLQQARQAGFTVGAYHFYETDDDPIAQANNFIKNSQLKSGDLAPVIDIEKLSNPQSNNFTADLTTFIKQLEKHYRTKPILYSNPNFANQYLSRFNQYPLWLADYDNKAQPVLPSAWSYWTFWQWTDTGTVDGISVNVDLDKFNGDFKAFQQYLIP